MSGLCRIVHSALAIQALRAPLYYFEENERKPHWWKCSGTAPQQATTVPLCMKGRDIKDKMDFWGRAKNKGNKSADHEGMTRLVSAEGAGRKERRTIALPAKWHVEELKNPHKKCLLNSLNPQELGDCRLALVSPRGVDFNSPQLFFPNFLSQIFPPFWQTTWQRQGLTGAMALVYTHQTQTKPNLIKAWWVPLPQLPFWSVGCLCVWSVSVCALNTIILLPNLHGNSRTDKNMFALTKSVLVFRDTA